MTNLTKALLIMVCSPVPHALLTPSAGLVMGTPEYMPQYRGVLPPSHWLNCKKRFELFSLLSHTVEMKVTRVFNLTPVISEGLGSGVPNSTYHTLPVMFKSHLPDLGIVPETSCSTLAFANEYRLVIFQ